MIYSPGPGKEGEAGGEMLDLPWALKPPSPALVTHLLQQATLLILPNSSANREPTTPIDELLGDILV